MPTDNQPKNCAPIYVSAPWGHYGEKSYKKTHDTYEDLRPEGNGQVDKRNAIDYARTYDYCPGNTFGPWRPDNAFGKSSTLHSMVGSKVEEEVFRVADTIFDIFSILKELSNLNARAEEASDSTCLLVDWLVKNQGENEEGEPFLVGRPGYEKLTSAQISCNGRLPSGLSNSNGELKVPEIDKKTGIKSYPSYLVKDRIGGILKGSKFVYNLLVTAYKFGTAQARYSRNYAHVGEANAAFTSCRYVSSDPASGLFNCNTGVPRTDGSLQCYTPHGDNGLALFNYGCGDRNGWLQFGGINLLSSSEAPYSFVAKLAPLVSGAVSALTDYSVNTIRSLAAMSVNETVPQIRDEVSTGNYVLDGAEMIFNNSLIGCTAVVKDVPINRNSKPLTTADICGSTIFNHSYITERCDDVSNAELFAMNDDGWSTSNANIDFGGKYPYNRLDMGSCYLYANHNAITIQLTCGLDFTYTGESGVLRAIVDALVDNDTSLVLPVGHYGNIDNTCHEL